MPKKAASSSKAASRKKFLATTKERLLEMKNKLLAEIETEMKETGLDQQMKSLGYWDDWQSGARGRKP